MLRAKIDLKQPASYSSSPRTRRTVTVSRNTWFQRCSQGSGIRRCQSRQGGGTMLQDGSSWRQPMRRRPALPDCTARPTGRTAQPPAACAKPLNGPCGQGEASNRHMPCELWLHYCIEKYAPRMGRSGRHSGCAHSTACSVRPYCVHVRKRDKNCGMQRC